MKAPLRFAFGWVLYVAIFAAVNPVVRAVADAIREQPIKPRVKGRALRCSVSR